MEFAFDIQEFGAAPGNESNTKHIQDAINACHESGGGRVFCGKGVFHTGPLEMKSNVELHLSRGSVLKAIGDIAIYEDFRAEGFIGEKAPERTSKYLLKAAGAHNIALTGPGILDASGLSFYTPEELRSRKKPAQRPRALMFYKCTGVLIEGVSMVDAPCWTVWLMKCEDVRISRVNISGDYGLINNDGIDIDSCRRVTVSDSVFDTEDDCIVVRAIGGVYDRPGASRDVAVSNCLLSSQCNGIRIGCPADGEISDCVFSNITLKSKANGVIIQNPRKYLDGAEASADIHDLAFSNFTVDCGGIPIWVSVEEGIALKRLSGIKFSNFRIRSGAPCTLRGSPETIIKDISLTDIDLDTSSEDAVSLGNCENIKLNNVNVVSRDDEEI